MAVFCTGAPELKEYSWKKYNAVEETNTYTFWEKWSAVSTAGYSIVESEGAESTGWVDTTNTVVLDDDALDTMYKGGVWRQTYYASDYTFDTSTGKFTLVNPTYVEVLYDGPNMMIELSTPAGTYLTLSPQTTANALFYAENGWFEQMYYSSPVKVSGKAYTYTVTNTTYDAGYDKYLTSEYGTAYSKGSTSYGTVSSTNSSAYPSNGYKDGYWYVKTKTESTTGWAQGSTLQDTVTSFSPVAYPEDGYQDGYWYVRV